MKKLGIYIHIPFCKKKCNYCDFISFPNLKEYEKEYINALINEIQAYKNKDYIIDTIYIGGGTPSYIDSIEIIKIIEQIKLNYTVKDNLEITIEVNPGTINKKKLIDYKNSGINRISIGLQTTSNTLLKEISRIHTYEQFLETYKMIKEVGFENINVDLMLGIPNQTIKNLEDSITKVINLKPTHISIYSLILEEGTKMHKNVTLGKLKLPSEDIERKMYWEAKKMLEKNKYIHYEISNFALKNYESKHNVNCWNQKEYLGFGLAAHSYLNGKRYSNTIKIDEYISNFKGTKIINEVQTNEDAQKEYMMLGLRKLQGVNIQEFERKFKCNLLKKFNKEIEKLIKLELIKIESNNIMLTDKGIDFANIVWEEFV